MDESSNSYLHSVRLHRTVFALFDDFYVCYDFARLFAVRWILHSVISNHLSLIQLRFISSLDFQLPISLKLSIQPSKTKHQLILIIVADFSWRNRINKRWWKFWWKQRTSVFEYSLNSIIKIGLYDFTDSTISKLVHYEFNCSWHRLNHTSLYRLKNALVWTCLNQLEPVIKLASELIGHIKAA